MNEEIKIDFLKQVKLLKIQGKSGNTLIHSRINKDLAYYNISNGKLYSYHPCTGVFDWDNLKVN